MRVWMYYRLSRDEDTELHSLKNQRKILLDYIEENGYDLVGESCDDNVSGMTFDRDGIAKMYDAVDDGKIDAVIVKDLSRLGRHRTQTALCIDYLKTKNVRVLSVTENIDTLNESDDLMIGFKGIMNDFYARDCSRKVRRGYQQKQKDQGVCNMPPMGYYKDKNTNQIVIMEEPAEIIRQIFALYLDGYGFTSICKKLNREGWHSPSYYQKLYNNKQQGYGKPKLTKKSLWTATAVKRILQNEFYTGTLICHVEETNKIDKTRKKVPKDKQFRHENYAPAIIAKDIWDKVQAIINAKKTQSVRASSKKPYHRYTGLLKCGDCGFTFVAKKRKWKNKPERVEYVCNGYHRYGIGQCTPHRIREEDLDTLIYKELGRIKAQAVQNWNEIEKDVKKFTQNKVNISNKIENAKLQIAKLENDIEEILMERIRDKENREIYNKMIEKRRAEIKALNSKIDDLENIEETIKRRKANIKEGIDILDSIIAEQTISNANLRLLVKEIVIDETNGKLSIDINLNGTFLGEYSEYDENGNEEDLLKKYPGWEMTDKLLKEFLQAG